MCLEQVEWRTGLGRDMAEEDENEYARLGKL